MATSTGTFVVSADASAAFARLSGDYNPLHLDPLAARRTPFGGTVVHGVHLLLAALDEACNAAPLPPDGPRALSATFRAPIRTGDPVSLRIETTPDGLEIVGESGGRVAFVGAVAASDPGLPASGGAGLEVEPGAPEDADFPASVPSEPALQPSIPPGEVPLRLARGLLTELFPRLSRLASTAWIAEVLATTHVVGMRCPGLHSLYSGLKLKRVLEPGGPATLRYRVARTDSRFRMVRLEVTGPRLTGTLDTFFRPEPVAQRSMRDVKGVVGPDAFTGARVLVVGGSRGLGELAAKILAAGGARVVISYSRGSTDAERVCSEVRELGGDCAARPLDVLADSPEWLSESRFSHVCYFASPPITRNVGSWDPDLFRQFEVVYVHAFASLVERVVAGRAAADPSVRFLYPSTVFVDTPEPGFAEYAAAKAAGESLCNYLEGDRARFAKPRLPRIRTDQTSSFTGNEATDGFPVLLEVIHQLLA